MCAPYDRNPSTTSLVGKSLRLQMACTHIAQLCAILSLLAGMRTTVSLLSLSEVKLEKLVNALLADFHCTPCRNSQDEKQLKLILSLLQTSYIQHEIIHIHIALKQMHNRAYKKTINIPFNRCKQYSSQHHEIESKHSYITQVLMYMGSIASAICLYNFYSLCSSLLSYSLARVLQLRIMTQYNTYKGSF
jgi:hypothetical protein